MSSRCPPRRTTAPRCWEAAGGGPRLSQVCDGRQQGRGVEGLTLVLSPTSAMFSTALWRCRRLGTYFVCALCASWGRPNMRMRPGGGGGGGVHGLSLHVTYEGALGPTLIQRRYPSLPDAARVASPNHSHCSRLCAEVSTDHTLSLCPRAISTTSGKSRHGTPPR